MKKNEADRVLEYGVGSIFKLVFQKFVRLIHQCFFKKNLPNRFGIYLHELGEKELVLLRETVIELEKRGYEIVSLDEYLNSSEDDKFVWFSFDDNYSGWVRNSKALIGMGIRATFYINSLPSVNPQNTEVIMKYYDLLGVEMDRTPLKPEEIKQIEGDGHTIALHTHSHYNLGAVSHTEALEDIELNFSYFEKWGLNDLRHFSFPYGMPRNFPAEIRIKCEKYNFISIAHATPGMAHEDFRQNTLHRNLWRSNKSVRNNLINVEIDGRMFVKIFGRSPLG